MIRLTRVSGYFFVSLTILVYNTLFPLQCRAQTEVDWVVQPASRKITLTGYTRSQTTMTLSSEVAGRVLQINYEDGQVIGELPFLRIDSTFVDLEISSIQHALNQLEITGSKRRSRVDYLEKEYRRIENLFRRGSSPESRRDTALEDGDQARPNPAQRAGRAKKPAYHLRTGRLGCGGQAGRKR